MKFGNGQTSEEEERAIVKCPGRGLQAGINLPPGEGKLFFTINWTFIISSFFTINACLYVNERNIVALFGSVLI
jgi:hypothetical protein